MKVLVVGGGGREHALCDAIAGSPLCTDLVCAPGNAGIAAVARCESVKPESTDAVVDLAVREKSDLVVVGPEAPLVAGLVDRLRANGIPAFGPTAAAAELEGSKAFMKDLCRRHNVPTARYGRFGDAASARAYAHDLGAPLVVKADGLAAGKGVILCNTLEEADDAIDSVMVRRDFGAAGDRVVVEERLSGPEASFFALVDGERALPLAAAQDYKAVGDGDTGPNTGGMGAFSPTPRVDAATEKRVMDEIIDPVVKGMAAEGRAFTGVLFAGLMLTEDGPKVLEFNVRFGDPECQVLLPRLADDILPVLAAAAEGGIESARLAWQDRAALTVVLAARGYPGAYDKGTVIEGVADAAALDDAAVYHAGTARDAEGNLVAAGGRVLNVTGLGPDLASARERAYAAVDTIRWPEGFCRRDIGAAG